MSQLIQLHLSSVDTYKSTSRISHVEFTDKDTDGPESGSPNTEPLFTPPVTPVSGKELRQTGENLMELILEVKSQRCQRRQGNKQDIRFACSKNDEKSMDDPSQASSFPSADT